MFTIEVKKKEKDEGFGFEDLEMFHRECCGGKLKTQTNEELICLRCGEKCRFFDQEVILQIIKTAIDGEKRELKKPIVDDDGDLLGYKYNITVIQKP